MARKVFACLLFSLIFLPILCGGETKEKGRLYRVAVIPFSIHSQENLDYLREGIYDILVTRITVEGRITVIDRSSIERALYEIRPTRLDEATVAKIGDRVGADYVVLGSVTKIGNYISLDARMINITEGKPPLTAFTQHKGLEDVMIKIGEFAQDIGAKILGRPVVASRRPETGSGMIIRTKDTAIFGREGATFKRSQAFNFEIKGVDVGDVDGDGKNEVVAIDTSNIYIFKYDGESLKLFQKIQSHETNNFLTLDVADVNRNGIAEIIVTNVFEDNLRSFIIEFEEGKFRKITEKAGWYFRVLEHPKEGPILMGQLMGSEGVFVGPIYRMVWEKKSFERGPKMDFPPETILFGVAKFPVPDEKGLLTLVLEDSGRITIFDANGKYRWTSRERYGGTDNSYDTRKKGDVIHRGDVAPQWRVYIPGRILVKDLDGDGDFEVIVTKNHSATYNLLDKVRSFIKGEIHSLVWEQGILVSNWKTKEMEGYISDFQIKDFDNDGEEELVVSVVNYGSIMDRKGRSHLYFFKLY